MVEKVCIKVTEAAYLQCVVETAPRDATEAWSASGQSPSHPDAPACQDRGAAGMDRWAQFISIRQTAGTFCPEHEVAETKATEGDYVIKINVIMCEHLCTVYGMNANNGIGLDVIIRNIKPVHSELCAYGSCLLATTLLTQFRLCHAFRVIIYCNRTVIVKSIYYSIIWTREQKGNLNGNFKQMRKFFSFVHCIPRYNTQQLFYRWSGAQPNGRFVCLC